MEGLFSVRDVARIFDLTESRLRYWAQTGFVNPSGRLRGRRAYTFGDLVEIKAAKSLLDAGIPLQRVRRNLRALRESLPGETHPLGRLRVWGDGEQLMVVESDKMLDPVSGQTLLDFRIGELDSEVASVLRLDRERQGKPAPAANGRISASPGVSSAEAGKPPGPHDRSAYSWFVYGCAIDGDPARSDEAIAAYSEAIRRDPGLAAAHTNLGNLYYTVSRRSDALRCYEKACALDPDQPEAHYNLANIYEEEGDFDLAIAEYRRSLRLEPAFADAHFNLALALEQVGSRRQAAHHWERYLELSSREDEDVAPWRDLARRHLERLRSSPG